MGSKFLLLKFTTRALCARLAVYTLLFPMEAPVAFHQDLLAILDEFSVPANFRDFLKKYKCLTVKGFSMTAANEERILYDVIQASGLEGDLDFGGKLCIRLAWDACRNQSPGAGGGLHKSAAAPKKRPTGVETRLRKVWLDLHRFNLNGNWLVQDELITKICEGLHEEARELYIYLTSQRLSRSPIFARRRMD